MKLCCSDLSDFSVQTILVRSPSPKSYLDIRYLKLFMTQRLSFHGIPMSCRLQVRIYKIHEKHACLINISRYTFSVSDVCQDLFQVQLHHRTRNSERMSAILDNEAAWLDSPSAYPLRVGPGPQPDPADDEVVIKVAYGAVNPLDWKVSPCHPLLLSALERTGFNYRCIASRSKASNPHAQYSGC